MAQIRTTDADRWVFCRVSIQGGRFTVTQDQVIIIVIGVATILMFLWGRWRHDMVAAGSLLACVLAGLVPSSEAFAGFGHPAVITVACVLILSQGLKMTGAVDALVQGVMPTTVGPTLTIAALSGLVPRCRPS